MPKKKQLSKAEAYYIENHWGRKPPQQIAEDLGLTTKVVEAYLDKLREAGVEQPADASPTGPQKAGFLTHKGVTSMTPESSIRGDEHRGVTFDQAQRGEKKARPRNEEFFKRRGGGIHVIDPSKPIQ